MKDKKKQAQENQPEEETVETDVAEEACEDVAKEEPIFKDRG